MMTLWVMQDVTHWVAGVTHWSDVTQLLHWIPLDLGFLDKPLESDPFGDVQRWFSNAMKTGQVWAFLFGLIFGYLIKTFTSFG